MNYALNISEDGRILSVTFAKFATDDMVLVEQIPEGNVSDYLYENGKYVYSPVSDSEKQYGPLEVLLGVYE